jgi:hypothetical protein
MEQIIRILMLFVLIGTVVKLSFWKWWQAVLFGLVCALFVIITCRYAILQSKTQLDYYLNNKQVMQNIAVLVTIEAVLSFAFVFTEIFGIDGRWRKLRRVLLLAYPGLLVFPVLFYLLTRSIYIFAGVDFGVISYWLALGVFITIPLFSYILKRLCPDKEFRLEIYLLISVFICIIGLIATANGDIVYIK